MAKKDENGRSFFGILVGIFGIFLLWSSYNIFIQTKVLDLIVIISFAAGLGIMFFSYKLIVG